MSLVMPCHNEEAIVGQTIKRLLQAFERAEIPIELVTVDNGSRDRTLAILEELSARHREIVIVRVADNVGYGLRVRGIGKDRNRRESSRSHNARRRGPIGFRADLVDRARHNEQQDRGDHAEEPDVDEQQRRATP